MAQRSLEDDKAQGAVVIDLTNKSSISDHLLIATGTSARHLAAMAEHLVQHFKAAGLKRPTVEGKTVGDWVLVDAGDVIVHLFRDEVRKLYNLEKLWGDPVAGTDLAAGALARRRTPLGADLGA